jgi:hypothetical protein
LTSRIPLPQSTVPVPEIETDTVPLEEPDGVEVPEPEPVGVGGGVTN